MNGSASGAGGDDEDLPAPHELGEELKFTGRYESPGDDTTHLFYRLQLQFGLGLKHKKSFEFKSPSIIITILI